MYRVIEKRDEGDLVLEPVGDVTLDAPLPDGFTFTSVYDNSEERPVGFLVFDPKESA